MPLPYAKYFKGFWYIWCKAIGCNPSDGTTETDIIACCRTFWVLLHVATCLIIITNIIHHW